MNLIDALKEAAALGFRSATTDGGLGPQEWEIEELISDFTEGQNRILNEEDIAEDVQTTDYVEDEWGLDRQQAVIERLDYKGVKTGDHYKLA